MNRNRRHFIKSAAGGVLTSVVAPFTSWAGATVKGTRYHDDLVEFDALGLAQLIKKKEISAGELLEVVIRRIEAVEPIINAISTQTFERARANADKISTDSTFAGVPILIKDMIDVGGVRRTDGSRLLLTNVPQKNVAYINGVEASGMNIVGMTNVPEFAQLGIVTNNSAFGKSRNPWDLSKSTLGSSGGAAAAVAAGILPLVHGTDGGGSNRLPASANGVFGMKPSLERMLSGEANGGHSQLKTNQAISRTVRDSAALFNETEDKSGKIFKPVGLVEGPNKRRLRIGFAGNMKGGLKSEAGVMRAMESSTKLLQDLGHEVVLVEMPIDFEEFFKNFNGAFLRRFGVFSDMATGFSGRSAADSGLLDPWTASLIGYGASISEDEERRGLAYLAKVPGMFEALFEKVDILMSPVMPVVSVGSDELRPVDKVNDSHLEFLQQRMQFTASSNVAGIPAMSVPLHWERSSGLPVGTMFQSAIGNDRMLYELAFELEEARPWRSKWAPYSVKHIPI